MPPGRSPAATAASSARATRRGDDGRLLEIGGLRLLVGSAGVGEAVRVGRLLVGNAGVLLTEVLYLKPGEVRNFCIVDAAMNDLMRPAMYEAWMRIEPCTERDAPARCWDVVGPVCESGDWLARDRLLAVQPGDLLAVTSAGAYGMAMSSNYNTRGRAAEVMVDGGRAFLVREREQPAQLFAGESRLP